MALHWRPVGPEPAATYWQRRAVVATGVVLLVALLVSLLPGGDEAPDRLAAAPGGSPAPTSAAASAPAAAPQPTASSAVPICQPEALKVEALAGKDDYAVGADVRLTLQVTNTGTGPCTRDLGQAAVELMVTSGSDRIWSSDDCAPGGPKAVTTLAPGEPQVQRVTWSGRRSRPGCTGDKERAQAGTYRVTGRVGQLKVEGDVFRLTG